MPSREFSMGGGCLPPDRTVDDDAPEPFRQELIDLLFSIGEQNDGTPSAQHTHRVFGQSLGLVVAGNPFAGYRHAAGRDIRTVEWPRVYDLILRFVPEFQRVGLFEAYRQRVDQLLAAYGIVWDMDETGRLVRTLPAAAQAQVAAAVQELSDARFAAALALFIAARDAYDDRPRRDRDACSNVFDAMESVAKEKRGLPNATFGHVLAVVRQGGVFQGEIQTVLEGMNTLRNRNFGHGMVTPFALTAPEVDFTYLACTAGILLFARTP